jgi:hypothetical protein
VSGEAVCARRRSDLHVVHVLEYLSAILFLKKPVIAFQEESSLKLALGLEVGTDTLRGRPAVGDGRETDVRWRSTGFCDAVRGGTLLGVEGVPVGPWCGDIRVVFHGRN